MLFRMIVADPPWKKPETGVERIPGRPPGRYRLIKGTWYSNRQTLSVAELCSMRIPAMDDSFLFLWCTASNMPWALRVVDAWGFKFKTSLVWVKTTKDGTRVSGKGFGYWTMVKHELLLMGVRGKPMVGGGSGLPSVFLLPYEDGGLGKKPDVIYQTLVDKFGGPALEMFARDKRPRYFCWGDEVRSDVSIEVPNASST